MGLEIGPIDLTLKSLQSLSDLKRWMNLTDEMLPTVFWDQWGRAEPLTLDRESFTVEKRLCWPASLDLLLCLWGLEVCRVNLGSFSHLLLLKLPEPHQMGKADDQWGPWVGTWGRWGLAWLGFCLVLRVTSGVAFLPLFSQVSGYLCSVTLGASQAPNKESEPVCTLYMSALQ